MPHVEDMRITLSIDDDVLAIAKSLARQQGRSIGSVISDLARQGMQRPSAGKRNGIPLLPVRRGSPVTLEIVNALRDEST
jgi:hypothetical protein